MDNDGYFSDIAFLRSTMNMWIHTKIVILKYIYSLKTADFSAFTMKIKIAFLTMKPKTCVINSN